MKRPETMKISIFKNWPNLEHPLSRIICHYVWTGTYIPSNPLTHLPLSSDVRKAARSAAEIVFFSGVSEEKPKLDAIQIDYLDTESMIVDFPPKSRKPSVSSIYPLTAKERQEFTEAFEARVNELATLNNPLGYAKA